MDCWYSLEPPRRGGSNEYPQSMSVLSRNTKNISDFLSEIFHFLVVRFSINLNRHAFVMKQCRASVDLHCLPGSL